MPTVLVYPPEDEAMPWCAFDAGQDSAEAELIFTTPEMELLQSELDDWPQTVHPHAEHVPASSFHSSQADCAVVLPRRGSSHRSLSGGANLRRLSSIPESPKRAKERDDDDIVEVMKVRRGEGMPDVAYAHGSVPTRRRSKTLRSRAAQALRSIKNVGKVPRRPTLEHVVPAKENRHSTETKDPAPTEVPPTPTAEMHRTKSSRASSQSSIPRLKKRVSQPLSNLFGLGLGSSESAPNTANAIGSSSYSEGFRRTMPYSRSASASTPALQLFKDKDEGAARPTSPTFSIRGTRHKFSFVNLQSIFSGNTAHASDPVLEAQQAAADPEADDAAQPRAVQTPVDIEDGWDDSEDYDSPRRHADLGTMRRPSDESFFPEQEISFEMRLNSMHFDSFDIDADAF
ncbi:hypothetical protein BC826DRAFT_971903 [Russula brevipes]|nr:hypothetical protein BC826DRAFT_971903 [Russula brevipes]